MNNQKGLASIFIVLILIVGLILGIYLVQQRQSLRTRANIDELSAFEIKDQLGQPLKCDTSKNPPECFTTTRDFSIRLKDINNLP